jgi:hypothetical protein
MSAIDWRPLDAALARLAADGARAALWWRDDDAVAHTPALDRLLALAARDGWPLALAAIPARVEPSLGPRLAAEPARLLVHGLAHANHAGPGAKRAEFGADRPLDALAADAARGLALAQGRPGPWLPVLVPPWNRIAPDLVPCLTALGYRGLSTFGARVATVPGLVQANAHLDPIDWHGGRGLAGPDALVAGLAAAIARRAGPVGLLTHHLVHDRAVWDFMERLSVRLAAHPAVDRPPIEAIFGLDGPPGVARVIER